MKHIVFFGDSLTAGFGLADPNQESFPALIQNKINAFGYAYQVINAGQSGDTTSSALNRLHTVIEIPADVFAVALGANDMLRGYAADSTAANLLQIISRLKTAHPDAKLVLLGMELPAWITAARANQYRNLFRSLAEEYGMPFLPFLLEGVAGKREYNLPDGLHPNARGYQVIAERVWPVIHSLLDEHT